MSDLHEGCGEEHDIGRMETDALGSSFPLDRTHVSVWVSMSIDKEPKRVINEQELAFCRPEDA